MYYEYWIRGNFSKKFSETITRNLNDRAWGIDENDALQNFFNSGFKDYNKKEFVATVRILPTGRKKNTLKGKHLPFIPVPENYDLSQKKTLSYYCMRIQHLETLKEVDQLIYDFNMKQSVENLTKEHQAYLRKCMFERSKLIFTGEVKPYIYALSYDVPNEWSSDKKFTHYVHKSIHNLKLAGYKVKKDGMKFEVTGSEWIQHDFFQPLSQHLLPVELIIYWEHIAPFYKNVNNHVDVLPDSHKTSVIRYVGMQSPGNLNPHFKQLEKEQIYYWLSDTDGMTCINVLQEDYLKAKKALRDVKPKLLASIDDLFDNFDDDFDENVDKNGNLTEAFWESYD